jgi:3-phytase
MLSPAFRVAAPCAALLTLMSCERQAERPTREPNVATVPELWVSALDTLDNIDSPALWFSPDGPAIIATAKASNRLMVYDANTGAQVRSVGEPGSGPGQLRRPNGILVLGDSVALVVERDNRRVQAFGLPDFRPFGSFGATELLKPYGLAAHEVAGGVWHVYVTDNYETPDGDTPPLGELGRRVKQYAVSVVSGRVRARLLSAFGDTTAAGAIRVTESIALDPARDRLVLAEEDETATQVKEYTLDGRFTGRTFGLGLLTQQAEGLALWTCGDDSGYWVVTDQGPRDNFFLLFDRSTLAFVGSVRGAVTNTTDGIALTQRPVGEASEGMLVASHFDAGLSAFRWRDIASATGASVSCPSP